MLTPQQIADRVTATLGTGVLESTILEGPHPTLVTTADNLPQLAAFLRDDANLRFDMLRSITGLDYPDRKLLCAAYDLMSFDFRHEICVKVFVPRDNPVIPSTADIWRAADWHERETYDLLGITFTNHPDAVAGPNGLHPRRILLPDDWEGFPLRKDYAFPREYEGIPGSVELEWAQKPEYPK